MNGIQYSNAVLGFVFLGMALGCAADPSNNVRPEEPPANPVVVAAAGQTVDCRPNATALNQLTCESDDDCGDASLECRPHTGLCMPVESTSTGCLFDDDKTTELCDDGYQCVQGYCILDTVAWVEPRPCAMDSECATCTDAGEVEAGSTRCNHRVGGYCLAECVEGEACDDGVCGCDGRCPSEEAVFEYAAGGAEMVVDVTDAIWPVTVDPVLTTVDWMVETDQTTARMGKDVAPAGDVNGDGYDDVFVGAYQYDNGETDEGPMTMARPTRA